MSAETAGVLALVIYLLMLLAVVVYQAVKLPDGWRAWILFAITRVYAPGLWKIKRNQRCPFPGDSAGIIIANHRSPADPIILWYNSHLGNPQKKMRCISFLMAREYYERPGLVGWISRAMHSIPVERNGKDVAPVREALRKLKQGDLIGVFPEGGIQEGRSIKHANSGIAFLALRSQAPVYPVYINNSPGGKNMVEPFYSPAETSITYGEPIDLSAYYDLKHTKEILEEVTTLMMWKLAELGDTEYLGAPRPDEQAGLIPMSEDHRRTAN
ncbi:1-acyl-sn-glycerol-3-phosphate acyltransferase [Gimesia benthica]|uniref:1-acyl-sn-glycerol-3-phosphate acyltransferase n=1 Tax=Gimesia benthica TaxID=2608982 RepID=A0A6I6AIF9_9PLAN|nr:lysophospholipid acyltransferase family protein [Gimesia benthica]QGQ25906.1 1-acyl-sn-glycerol-3-phosphate acyltransferase [Gimesia benthica]